MTALGFTAKSKKKNFFSFNFRKISESTDSLEEVEEVLNLKATEYADKKELVDNLEKTLAKVKKRKKIFGFAATILTNTFRFSFQLKTSRQNRYQWLLKFKSHVSIRVQHEFNVRINF